MQAQGNTTTNATLTESITQLLGTGLTETVAIYVPSTVQANQTALANSVLTVTNVSTELAKMFGGFTSYEATGGWVSEEHGLIQEGVTVVTAKATKYDLAENIEKIVQLAKDVKWSMSQEAVSVEINGVLYFI